MAARALPWPAGLVNRDVTTVGIYWHIILWKLCHLNSNGQI